MSKLDVTKEQYNWRQDTPELQSIVIRQNLDMTIDNFLEGYTTKERLKSTFNKTLAQLLELEPYLQGKKVW